MPNTISTIQTAWTSVSISASGQYQTATTALTNEEGYIYVSTNYGENWVIKNYSGGWNTVSVSASGQYQTAVGFNAYITISSDFGKNWTPKSNSFMNCKSVSVSASGQYQTALNDSNYIVVSSDFGNTWVQNNSVASENYKSVSISASGQYQTAVVAPGYIYTSVISTRGSPGTPGQNGTVLSFADFYGLSNSSSLSIAGGAAVNFPSDGVNSGLAIYRNEQSEFEFILSNAGVYEVNFQVSVSQGDQLLLRINGSEIDSTIVGNGESQIVGMCLIQTSQLNSMLAVCNPTDSPELLIPASVEGKRSVSRRLVIKQLS